MVHRQRRINSPKTACVSRGLDNCQGQINATMYGLLRGGKKRKKECVRWRIKSEDKTCPLLRPNERVKSRRGAFGIIEFFVFCSFILII
jgi:hypothetical protein